MHLSVSLTAYLPFERAGAFPSCHTPDRSPVHRTHTHTHGLETFNLARMSPD